MNKRELLGRLLYLFGTVFKEESDFLSIYFHAPAPELFEKIVVWCKRRGYRFIDIDECYGILAGKCKQHGKVVFFSFDDGWLSNLELVPVVNTYRVPITIFIAVDPLFSGNYWWEYVPNTPGAGKREGLKKMKYADFVKEIDILKSRSLCERSSMTEQDLAGLALNPLVSIQSHTMSHPVLTNCPDDVLEYELTQSKKILEDKLGREVFAFSFPNGDYGEREMEAVKKAGYKIAFTTEPRIIDISDRIDLFSLPRMAVNTDGGYYENLSKIIGVWQRIVGKRRCRAVR